MLHHKWCETIKQVKLFTNISGVLTISEAVAIIVESGVMILRGYMITGSLNYLA
jgi:hypothetical protein